jgi:uncharacterized protein (TIGR03437 family)
MSYRFLLPLLGGIVVISALVFPASQLAQIKPEHGINERRSGRFPGKDWSGEKMAREAWARHEFNQQRRAQTGLESKLEANITDINDISVIEDDGSIIVQRNLFDLVARTVTFMPSGSGYAVSNAAGSFDTNLGRKLDLTQAPAVNPKIPGIPGVEPGDDAYIEETLGLNFNFYGTTYTKAGISSNGNVTFRATGVGDQFYSDSTVDAGESIATLQAALPRIAPYWHDLDARATSTTGTTGVYIRTGSDPVVITWNNIRDFPNNVTTDTGVHRFQMKLFQDGRIQFVYDAAQLTSEALVGISPGNSATSSTSVDFANPTIATINTPIAEYFSLTASVDDLAPIQAFYNAHPNQDVYDFVYLIFDFDVDLGSAFAYYQPFRNDVQGIGEAIFDTVSDGRLGARRIFGELNLANLIGDYPTYPTDRFFGANSALSIFGQEQGHRWLSFVRYPGTNTRAILGRDFGHWNFFLNIESSLSHPAARRSSSMEGNVWRENSNGTFTSENLVDGYSRLDHYLMGLRPASDISPIFLITNPSGTSEISTSSPSPNETVTGTKQAITIDQIVQQNGSRFPDANSAQKNFRAATLLVTRRGTTASAATLAKITRYRLAWESYFAQSTDYLATINTGLAALTTSRWIAMTNGASYTNVLTPGAIGSIFGQGLASGTVNATLGQALPTSLGGIEVKVNGVSAPLFFVSPGQVNFQMPRSIPATTTSFFGTVQSSAATVEIFQNGQLIRAGAAQIAPALIGQFTATQNGSGAAAALDAITFTSAPFNAKQSNGQPSFIALFVTGLGAEVTDNDGDVKSTVQVTVNGNPVTVSYAGRAPGFVGLNQINFQLPTTINAGTYNVVVSRNGFVSNTATIVIQ